MPVRKLKIKDTLYIFEVPKTTNLDPNEIVREGKFIAYKEGAKVYMDAANTPIGIRAKQYDPIQLQLTEYTHSLMFDINIQAQKARKQLEMEEKYPGPKLYQLALTTWNGKQIQREDEPTPRYFIRTFSICANCSESIPGTQTLYVNKSGRVEKADSLVPDNPEVTKAKEFSKKLLCPECKVSSLKNKDLTMMDIIETCEKEGVKVNINLREKNTLEACLLEILNDQDTYSSEFARGASYIFHMQKLLSEA